MVIGRGGEGGEGQCRLQGQSCEGGYPGGQLTWVMLACDSLGAVHKLHN